MQSKAAWVSFSIGQSLLLPLPIPILLPLPLPLPLSLPLPLPLSLLLPLSHYHYKSGDKNDPTNYRGICVSSCLGKRFCSILNRRLHLYFDENKILRNFQIGFWPENRMAGHVFTLSTLIDKYVHHHKEKV